MFIPFVASCLHLRTTCISIDQLPCLIIPNRHGVEINKLMNEMESQKELLLTYEQTLTHKDSIVANITDAIKKQVISNL